MQIAKRDTMRNPDGMQHHAIQCETMTFAVPAGPSHFLCVSSYVVQSSATLVWYLTKNSESLGKVGTYI